MGILVKSLLGRNRRAISPENPSYSLNDPAVADVLLDADGAVGVEKALSYAALWRGVRLLSSAVGKLPLVTYRKISTPWGDGKERASDHPAYNLLCYRPSPAYSAYTFKETLMAHALLKGNGYAYVFRDQFGKPVEIVILNPDRVTPLLYNSEPWYLLKVGSEERRLPGCDVLHLKGLGWNGLEGFDVLSLLSEQVSFGLNLRAYGVAFFDNSARASVVLVHPGKLDKKAVDNIRDSWERMHQGVSNAHRTAVLMEGMTVEQLSTSAADAELMAQREFELREVANILCVPPHKLGDPNRTSYSSLEQENQAFLDDSLDPWLVNLEQECREKLLTEAEKADVTAYIEFLRSALVRADMAARFNTYAIGITNGILNPNEARSRENLNPYEGGDVYKTPLNTAPAGAQPTPGSPPTPAPAAKLASACRKLLAACLQRCLRRLGNAAAKAAKSPNEFIGLVEVLGQEHRQVLAEMLEPVVEMLGSAGEVVLPPAEMARLVSERFAAELVELAGKATAVRLGGLVERECAKWEATWPDELAFTFTKETDHA